MKKIKHYLLVVCLSALAVVASSCSGGVTVTETEETYTMDNGIVRVMIAKSSGDLVSFRYEGKELLATILDENGEPDLRKDPPGANPEGLNRGMTDHQYGFWSHDAMGPKGSGDAITSITINPKKNFGKRAEISVKGISKGRKMGTGPGASPEGQFASDIDIRYALEKGASGVYTYCFFEHPADYPATSIGEARFCAKLAPCFDWMSVDKDVDFYYPKDYFAGDKYVYTAVQSVNPVFGWSSTTDSVGIYIINASMEYMSGGPTKVEFMGHRDTNAAAAACMLNYWRSSHYGGADLTVGEGEHWQKIIGPFMIYANSAATPAEMYADAKLQAAAEQAKWPYDWVDNTYYTSAKERAAVEGKLVLNDKYVSGEFTNLNVGLAAAAYQTPSYTLDNGREMPSVTINWQRDAKNYEFWNVGMADGSFRIDNVRPGKYTLYAFADGVLGEFSKADITVEAGKSLDLGVLEWTPVRMGEQVWEIGVPNRNASEFYMGSSFRDPEITLKYATMFPDDIHYRVGRSDWTKDWFFMQVPHNTDSEAKAVPFFGVRASGKATPYEVVFDMDSAPEGKAVLRMALCGTSVKSLNVNVNGTEAGTLQLPVSDNVIARHGSHGLWYETYLEFDASLLKEGENSLAVIVPEGSLNNGVLYDCLRLELSKN